MQSHPSPAGEGEDPGRRREDGRRGLSDTWPLGRGGQGSPRPGLGTGHCERADRSQKRQGEEPRGEPGGQAGSAIEAHAVLTEQLSGEAPSRRAVLPRESRRKAQGEGSGLQPGTALEGRT